SHCIGKEYLAYRVDGDPAGRTHSVLIRDISAKKLIMQDAPYLSSGRSTMERFGGGVTRAMQD
ncbi:MAG: hypothetical protein ACR2QW_02955, partial [bacterium]